METLLHASFISKILLANMPQLALSVTYFTFNTLITRAFAEMEWNSYSLYYKPLRVSHPQPGQTSSYRLQLPYKVGIPLMVFSTLMHWILSNAIYVAIIEGGKRVFADQNSCASTLRANLVLTQYRLLDRGGHDEPSRHLG